MSNESKPFLHELIDRFDPTKDDASFTKEFIENVNIDKFILLLERVLSLEEACLKRDSLIDSVNVIIHQDNSLEKLLFSTINAQLEQSEKFYNLLISLPELVTNLYGKDHAKFIDSEKHYTRLCTIIQRILKSRIQQLSPSRLNLFHFHYAIGRLCLKGQSHLVWQHFLCCFLQDSKFGSPTDQTLIILRHVLFNHSQDDCNRVSMRTNYNVSLFLEPILRLLFLRVSNIQFLRMLIDQDCWNRERDRLAMIIEKRILFGDSWFPNFERLYPDQVLLNLLLFFYESNYQDKNNVHMFGSIVKHILLQWRNYRLNKHRTYCQHFYLCRAFLLVVKICLQKTEHQCFDGDLLPEIQAATTESMAKHLDSIEETFQMIGITTNYLALNIITKAMNIHTSPGPLDKLVPHYQDNDDTRYLVKLAELNLNHVHLNPIVEAQQQVLTIDVEKDQKINKQAKQEDKVAKERSNPILGKMSNELDSDDDEDEDLVPMAMSDTAIEDDVRFRGREGLHKIENIQELLVDNKNRSPIYLKDLIEGLVDETNPYWRVKCIQKAETIIRAHFIDYNQHGQPKQAFSSLDPVSRRLMEVLFYAQLPGSQTKARERALVALCVGSPRIVSQYLTSMFYSREMSVRQRVMTLTTLFQAAQELSNTNIAQIEMNKEEKTIDLDQDKRKQIQMFRKHYFNLDESDSDDDEDGRDKLSLASSKTRVISLPREQPQATPNLFAPVASNFFFPLLRQPNRSELPYDLFGQDPIILEKLIYTLGGMMYFCNNHSLVQQMATELLDFVSQFHNHHERKIRLAAAQVFHEIVSIVSPEKDFQPTL